MELDVEAVRGIFEDVLSGRMLREQADRWAHAVVREEETGVVTYSPPRDRERIWAGVMYLYGIDAMTAPGAYLHTHEDITIAMMVCTDVSLADEEACDHRAVAAMHHRK